MHHDRRQQYYNNSSTSAAALLASTYESSILRNAKLRSAPQIELPHAEIAGAIASNTSTNAASGGGSRAWQGLVDSGADI